MKLRRFVIYSDAAGIYLGNALGLGFWSKWDPVGQVCAVTFPTELEANKHACTWESEPAGTRPHEVKVEAEGYATIAECVAAGLPAWDPESR